MSDIYHYWGNDLTVSPTGDLEVASATDSTEQEIIRALLTNPLLKDVSGDPVAQADYTDHPEWGAGLPRRIGSSIDSSELAALITSVLVTFPGVARVPIPSVSVVQDDLGTATVDITYYNTITGRTAVISFDLNK
ncbi:phage tail protein [Paraburkholderia phosphatilytica]|uniref:phage tail protein n=1 Tax=Paraburkholderia phosphatilytica TaxID=2282883 RepID=UPI000E50BED8|nr:phage tail protein [Paraburkholderia phosphatilytica]